MKPENRVIKLLLLAEVVLLVLVIVFGVVKKFHMSGMETGDRQDIAVKQQEEQQESNEDTQADIENAVDADSEEAFVTEDISLSAEAEEKLQTMSLEEKVAQLFLTTPESLTQMEQVNIAGAGTRNAINEYPVGGLIYSDINFQGREQVGNLMFNAETLMHERIDLYLFLAVRMDADDGTSVIGITDNYEPDAITGVFVSGRLNEESSGVTLPLHFPEQREAITSDTTWVMLGAQENADITGEGDLPCALSAKCVASVRAAGYQGVIMTDSLSAESISDTYSVKEAAVLAVQAGADMIYCPENFPDAYQAVLEAVQTGEIAESQIDQAVGRILTKKYQMPQPVHEDVDAVEVSGDEGENADDQET